LPTGRTTSQYPPIRWVDYADPISVAIFPKDAFLQVFDLVRPNLLAGQMAKGALDRSIFKGVPNKEQKNAILLGTRCDWGGASGTGRFVSNSKAPLVIYALSLMKFGLVSVASRHGDAVLVTSD
jgi:hypothetical protein